MCMGIITHFPNVTILDRRRYSVSLDDMRPLLITFVMHFVFIPIKIE